MWWLWIGAALAAPVSPDAVVAATLDHSMEVATAEARVETARGARAQATGPRANPEVQVGVGVDGSRVQGQVVQPVSLTGEGIQDRRAASAELEAAEAALERARFEAAAEARRAYARLALAEAELRIAEKQLEGATRLRAAAEARLEAGEAPVLDAQLARLEEARAVALWLDAGQEMARARADLVALSGVSPDVEVAADPLVAAAALQPDDVTTPTRSDVVAAVAEVEAAEAALSRERSAVLAPMGLGVFYESDQGRTVVGPMVTMELPLWKQNQGGRATAKGDLLLAEAGLEATQSRADAEERSTTTRIEATERAEELLRTDLAGDTDAAWGAIEQGYTLGEVDLTTTLLLQARVMEGERAWYAAHAAIADARIDVALARQDPSLLGSGTAEK